jgi:hypothetical protein
MDPAGCGGTSLAEPGAMSEERDDPLKSGGTLDLVVFLLWATVIVFALSQL